MEDYDTTPSSGTSLLRFAIIGIVLVALLLAALYGGKQFITASQANTPEVSKTPERKPEVKKETKSEPTAKKEAPTTKPDTSKPETKPAPATAPTTPTQPAPKPSAPPAAPSSPAPATGGGGIASTGPEDTVLVIVGVFGLTYATYLFVSSRRALHLLER